MPKSADEWIKDGTVETVPETVSTPVVEAVAETPTTDTTLPRDEHGRFVSAAPVTEAAASVSTAGTPVDSGVAPITAPAEGAQSTAATPPAETAAAVEEFLEARRGDKPYQFPKDVALPWKRGNETGYTPVEEILKGYMMEKDYRIKTQATAEEKRQVAIERARITAEKEAIAAEREQLRAAMVDPEKLEAYQQHYEQMRTNPVYKKFVEDALDKRITEAELNVRLETERDEIHREAAANLVDFINETAAQYPGVDPERVRSLYSRGLMSGDIPEVSEASVHQVYKQEAEYTNRILTPIHSEMTELRAQIAKLTDAKGIEAHNASTDKKLAIAKAEPIVAALGNGTPVVTGTQPTVFTPFTSTDYPDRIRTWSRQRD